MNLITHNPYRYLGVYSNSPTRERVANQAKMNAFLKVGRQVSFPLDMSDLLGPINRTSENVADALAKLTLSADQIKYAQFWWMKATHIDNIAYNHLLKGDVDMAKAIWEVKEDASSLQNRIVLSLVQSDYSSAIRYAQTLYNNYASSFVSNIVEAGVSLDGTALAHNFIDALIEEGFDISQLQNLISDNEWIAYLSEKTVVPLIDRIDQAITIAQTSKGKGPMARYEAGQILITSTKCSLTQLIKLIPQTDIRYETIADKLGLEILQCCIDYYNRSEEEDYAHKAQEMQRYAQSIVVGEKARQRCEKNGRIIDKEVAKAPKPNKIPKAKSKEYSLIMKILKIYENSDVTIKNALYILRETRPILRMMRSEQEKNEESYLSVSTLVVISAMHNVVEEVNDAQRITDPVKKTDKMRNTLRKAWSAISYMDKFDIEEQFKEHQYKINRNKLKNLCKYYRIPTPKYVVMGQIPLWIAILFVVGLILSIILGSMFIGGGSSGILVAMGIFAVIYAMICIIYYS